MAKGNEDGTWVLSDREYQDLKDRDSFLTCLEMMGVDNWEGYEYACQLYRGEIAEDEI